MRAVADGIEALCQTIRAGLATATFAQRRLLAELLIDGVPVIYCKTGQRKHLIAEEYLASHAVGTGVFLVLAAKARPRRRS